MIWPKLSETLPGERRPDRCQACGWDCDLSRWREHDEADRKTATIVVLCLKCSRTLIEPHPRLYARLDDNEPLPGSMYLCQDCLLRSGLRCDHPDLRANGGTGLTITVAKPHTALACVRGGKGRGCHHITIWPAPPSACAGRVAREDAV